MNEIKTINPTYKLSAFNCPLCNAFSQQHWGVLSRGLTNINRLYNAQCHHCEEMSIWYKEKMIYPTLTLVKLPNKDLNQSIIDDYEEAKMIVNNSPRGAAALLRLSIQKLCKQLGEEGKNINTDISKLVEKGLPPTIQKALDIVRVIGNEAVHPGQIDLKDDQAIAYKLFDLVNIIAYVMITQPKEIELLYNSLPEEKRDQIEKRDQ